MRSKFFGLVLGCGVAALAVAPALACPFSNVQASSGQQQTAQAQPPAASATQTR